MKYFDTFFLLITVSMFFTNLNSMNEWPLGGVQMMMR